jgi:dTDP-4-dehydrorhamnose reductase
MEHRGAVQSGDFLRKALVLGGSGLLGGRIVARLIEAGFSTSFTYHSNGISIPGAQDYRLDISDQNGLGSLIKDTSPDLIVNAAALPSVDQCDKDSAMAFRVNAEPQKIVAENARLGATIAYISTSNIFGYSEKPFTEMDIPAPISTYGRTKLAGERYTMAHKRHLILRSDQIYGWTGIGQKKSFVERTLEKLEKGERVEVCADWYNCPTFADDIAISLEKLVKLDLHGSFHAVGPTYINRYDWALKIARRFDRDENLVKAIDSSVLNLSAKRPNCPLSNGKIVEATGFAFLSVDDGLARMKETRNIQRP